MAEQSYGAGAFSGSSAGGDGTEKRDEARDRAEQFGEDAKSTAAHYGEQARDKLQELGGQAQDEVDARRGQAAEGIERAADTIRERMPEDGPAARAGIAAANSMETAAGYIREHDTAQMWNDLETYARQHPAQALAGAIVTGFVLGRILR